MRTLAIGTNVIFNERVETSPVGLLQILLADGTAFTVGPNANLSIDRFVYDPDANTASVSATLTKGVFRFVGGRTSKTPDGVALASPVGTIGIRGAVVDIDIEGPSRARISLVFGKEVTLTLANREVRRLYKPGYSITVGPGAAGGGVSASVERTLPGFSNTIQQALTGAPGTNGGALARPTDTGVAASGVPRANSERSVAANAVPVPEPRPQTQPRGEVQTAIQNAGTDVVREDVVEVVDTGPGTVPPVIPEIPKIPELPELPNEGWPEPPELANITTANQVDSLAGTSATYSGTVNAVAFDPRTVESTGSYREANGSFLLRFDFGTREGTIGITGIEGRNFGGGLTSGAGENPGDGGGGIEIFSSDLIQQGGDATGAAVGYFTNGNGSLATGVYGGFSTASQAGDWAASGVLNGNRR